MDFMEFMKSQPLGNMSPIAGLSSSSRFNSSDCSEARNMRRMIDELERTRGRYESEQTNTTSFGKQMDMLSKQMSSLTEQQQSLLGYHIVRINSMIDDLRKSTDTMARHEREKFEQHAREEHERIQRETRERFGRREREERERREREEREQRENEERERKEREERERQVQEAKLREEFLNSPSTATSSSATPMTLPAPEDLDMSTLPNMDFGDAKNFPEFMELLKRQQQQAVNNASQLDSANALALDVSIPPPSRTVTPTSQKRRRSLAEAKSATKMDANESSDKCGSRLSSPMHKKAKFTPSTNESGVKVMNRNRLVVEPSSENANMDPESATSMVDDDDDEAAATMPIGDTPIGDCLPAELQAQLQAQALAMLQAQMEQNAAERLASVTAMDTSPDDVGNPIAPPKELTPGRAKPAGLVSSPNAPIPFINSIKAEPEMVKPDLVMKPEPQSSSSNSAAAPKESVEKSKKKKKALAKKSGGATKSEPVQAVEDTTIANPESVPLKNKAIHQWMAKDPERLYTADDIVNAGIRYRQDHTKRGRIKGKIYIVDDRVKVRSILKARSRKLWTSQGSGKWKIKL